MRIKVRNGNVNAALKVLKRKLIEDGRLFEAKERRYFEKDSDKARRKRGAAVYRESTRQRSQSLVRGWEARGSDRED